VSATCFASTSECARFFVGTGEHRFRHYDTRADKRAVLDLDVGKGVITSVASSADGYEAYVANARGMFEIVDLRAGKTRGKFKGNSGSIRQVAVHPDGAHVACAGLDQYVRVYDTATRKCVASAYAKQPLTAIVFDAHTPAFEAASVKKSSKKKKRAPDVDDDDARAEKKAKKKKKKIRERAVAVDDAAPKKKKKKKSKE
jgi:WD40 repeat protein